MPTKDSTLVGGSRTAFARCVTAEIRALLGVRKMSGRDLAVAINVSNNYLAKRLRDDAPLTLDDVERIVNALDLGDPDGFIARAVENQAEWAWSQVGDEQARINEAVKTGMEMRKGAKKATPTVQAKAARRSRKKTDTPTEAGAVTSDGEVG